MTGIVRGPAFQSRIAAPARGTPVPHHGIADPVPVLCALVASVAAGPDGPAPDVVPDTRLDDLAFDSLDWVALALRIEEVLGVAPSDDELATAADVRGLAAIVATADPRPSAPDRPAWALSRPATLVRRVLDATLTRAVVDVVARPRATGLEHLPPDGEPFLLCPDHASHLDVPSVRRVLPRGIRDRLVVAAAADYFFTRPLLGATVSLAMGAIPFGRTRDVLASLERVADALGEGRPVLLFPEGTRSADGRLGPMRDGVGVIVAATGVPVVPVHLDGTHTILPKGRTLPRRRRGTRVEVRFGAPLRFPTGTPAHVVAEEIGRAIVALGARV
ncbi:MAG: 1-acyl-sn-glycerol-3-phosphate acyltransferase [Chloroflexota bacterium]